MAGRLVEENTQVSVKENFGDDRLVECTGERDSGFYLVTVVLFRSFVSV